MSLNETISSKDDCLQTKMMSEEDRVRKLVKRVKDQTWINDMELKRIGKSNPLLYCPNLNCIGSRTQLDKTKCKECMFGAGECKCDVFKPQVIISSSNPYCSFCNGFDEYGKRKSLKGKSSSPWVSSVEDFCSESNMLRIIDYLQSLIFKYKDMDGFFWKRSSDQDPFVKTDMYSKEWTTDRHIHTRNGIETLHKSFKKIMKMVKANAAIDRIKHMSRVRLFENPSDKLANDVLSVISSIKM